MIMTVVRASPGHDTYYRELIMESESDFANLPKSTDPIEKRASVGSIAYLQDMGKVYMLGPDDVWREV